MTSSLGFVYFTCVVVFLEENSFYLEWFNVGFSELRKADISFPSMTGFHRALCNLEFILKLRIPRNGRSFLHLPSEAITSLYYYSHYICLFPFLHNDCREWFIKIAKDPLYLYIVLLKRWILKYAITTLTYIFYYHLEANTIALFSVCVVKPWEVSHIYILFLPIVGIRCGRCWEDTNMAAGRPAHYTCTTISASEANFSQNRFERGLKECL